MTARRHPLAVPLHEHHGKPTSSGPGIGSGLALYLTCPACGEDMTWQNGVRYQTPDAVGTAMRVVFTCARHGAYELAMTLARADGVVQPRPSGAEQRRRRATVAA